MNLIGKILLAALLLIFGVATLGMGICAAAYTMDTSGFSLLLGLPTTGLLGLISVIIWQAMRETKRSTHVAPSATSNDDP